MWYFKPYWIMCRHLLILLNLWNLPPRLHCYWLCTRNRNPDLVSVYDLPGTPPTTTPLFPFTPLTNNLRLPFYERCIVVLKIVVTTNVIIFFIFTWVTQSIKSISPKVSHFQRRVEEIDGYYFTLSSLYLIFVLVLVLVVGVLTIHIVFTRCWTTQVFISTTE